MHLISMCTSNADPYQSKVKLHIPTKNPPAMADPLCTDK